MNLKQAQGVLGCILVGAGLLIGLVMCTPAKAQLMAGKLTPIRAPICKFEKDMVEIAKADSKDGIPAAKALLMKKKECGMGEFMGTVKRIVIALPTERGATVRVLAVEVEMADGSKETYYVLTDVDIDGLQPV